MKLSFKFNRPVSPHLLIYNPKFNLLRSIFHRFSGIFLSAFICFFLIFFKIWFNNNTLWLIIFSDFLLIKILTFVKFLFILNFIIHVFFFILTTLSLYYDFKK